jgi:hypothetical protein
MHILTDAVLSSIKPFVLGYFDFRNLNDHEVELLQSITKRQRHKFQKYGIVPEQVLRIAYDYGCLPGEIPPKGGMKVKRLLDLLDLGPYRDAENRELALWFRNKIIKEEWMVSSNRKPRKDRRYFYVKLSHIY